MSELERIGGIGPETILALSAQGIHTPDDLIQADSQALSDALDGSSLRQVKGWQRQAAALFPPESRKIYVATFVGERGRATDAVQWGGKTFPRGQGVEVSGTEKAALERLPGLVFSFAPQQDGL